MLGCSYFFGDFSLKLFLNCSYFLIEGICHLLLNVFQYTIDYINVVKNTNLVVALSVVFHFCS